MLFWGRAIFCLMLSVVVLGSTSRTGIARIASPFHAVASAFIGAPVGIPCMRSFRSTGLLSSTPRPPQPAQGLGSSQRQRVGLPVGMVQADGEHQAEDRRPPKQQKKAGTMSPEKKARLVEENRLQVLANEVQLQMCCPSPPPREPHETNVPRILLPPLLLVVGNRWRSARVVQLRENHAVEIHWGACSHKHADRAAACPSD